MILFDRVTKEYPRSTRPALSEVTVEIRRGEFVYVVGKSGSGKSTMLRLVLQEDRPTSGSVLVAGRDVGRLPSRKVPLLRRGIGTVFQDFRLLPNKTVDANVAFALQVLGKPRSMIRQVVPETLEMVGLEGKGKRKPHQLSGGEQQRVAIARAVAKRPDVLLCDEPTGALDCATGRLVLSVIERVNRELGTTVAIITHNAPIAAMGDRVIVLSDGLVKSETANPTRVAADQISW
jgi:cell division transport system ATP-binding protein